MKRVKVLRGERKGDWGDLLDSSTLTKTAKVQFPDGEILDINMDWVMVFTANTSSPKSRLF